MNDPIKPLLEHMTHVWHRRWQVLITATVICLVGWAVVIGLPSQYRSTARIYIDTTNVLRTLLNGLAVENDIAQQVDLMRRTLLSNANLEKVVRMTDLQLAHSPDTPMHDIVENLRRRVAIDIESGNRNLFSISFQDTNAQRTYRVVSSLSSVFVENNLGAKRSDYEQAEEFLKRQIADYEKQLAQAEKRLAEFRQKHVDLMGGSQTFQARTAEVQGKLDSARAALNDALAKREALEKARANIPEIYPASAGLKPPADIDVKIMEVEQALRELRSRYTDQHPDVLKAQRLQKQLWEQRAADTGPSAASSGPGVLNPAHTQITVELAQLDATIDVFKGHLRHAEEEAVNLENDRRRVPELDAELSKLNRDYNVIKEKYEDLLSRREAARISIERERSGAKVAIQIVEPPEVPIKPAGPKRMLLAAGVLVGGIGAGIGVSVILTLLGGTFLNAGQLRQAYDLPVLGAISMVPTNAARVAHVADRFAIILAAGALLAVFAAILAFEATVGWDILVWKGSLSATAQDLTGKFQATLGRWR